MMSTPGRAARAVSAAVSTSVLIETGVRAKVQRVGIQLRRREQVVEQAAEAVGAGRHALEQAGALAVTQLLPVA